MTYKNEVIPEQEALNSLSKTQVNLKVIPDVNWKPKVRKIFYQFYLALIFAQIARLVSYNLTNIRLKGAWQSQARLHLLPHINAPAADLPVKKVIGTNYN
jgi:acetoacetate decarboxylase